MSLASSATAAADPKQACIEANTQAQIDQRQGHLRDARQRLLLCASQACPPVVRADCAHLLDDVTQSAPSVVVDARDESGAEMTRVRVYFDGALIAEHLDGLEIDLDPGEHNLRFDAGSGRVIEQTIVLREGERRRPVTVDFATPRRVAPPEPVQRRTRPPSHASIVPWALLSIGGLGAVGFATFGIAGYAQEKHLASSCAPRCADLSTVRLDYALSDVGLGMGAASLAGAMLYGWLHRSGSSSATALRVDLTPRRGGGQLAARWAW